jgi:hypothetical protein
VIRIGFSTSRAWYSVLIRRVTRSRCSHTFLVVDLLGVPMVLEEGPFGYFPSRRLADVPTDELVGLFLPHASQARLEESVRASLSEVGQMYGYLVLLGMAWVYFGRWLGKKFHNPLKSGKSNICSERNCKVLQAAGEPGVASFDPSSTSPEDLLALYD